MSASASRCASPSLLAALGAVAARRLRREHPRPDGRSPAEGRSATRRATSTPTGCRCAPPPEGTVPRERITVNPRAHHRPRAGRADAVERRAAAALRDDDPGPGHAQAARARAQALRHHLRAPATARSATATASWRRRWRCGRRRRCTEVRRPPGRLHLRGRSTKGFGLMASYAAELTVRGALGGRRLRARAAAQPDDAGRRAAAGHPAAARGAAGGRRCRRPRRRTSSESTRRSGERRNVARSGGRQPDADAPSRAAAAGSWAVASWAWC